MAAQSEEIMKGNGENGSNRRREDVMARLVAWKEEHFTERSFLFVLAVGVGLLAGAGATLLKFLIGTLSDKLTSAFSLLHPNWQLLVLPVAGIVITGIYCRYILKGNVSHGTARIHQDLVKRNYRLPGNLMYASIVASTLTIGFGGSAGSEGPIAYTGAAIGSNVGRWFRMSSRMMMILVGCGAAAGIAGIFKSPIGGTFFTLEVLRLELTTVSVIALVVTCITASMTAYILSGFSIDLDYLYYTPVEPELLLFVVGLGIFCGIYSAYYSYVMEKMDVFFTAMKNPWAKNLLAGGIVAVCLFLFPALYGEGYGIMGKVINGDAASIIDGSFFGADGHDPWILLLMAAGVLAAKCFATSSTNSGGGVGGDFAPTLFAGVFAGYLFAGLVNQLCGLDLSTGKFAFLGMAGVMAGAIRAPLMAIFLTVEMTGAYTLFLPVLITATFSFGTVTLFSRHSFYTKRSI